MHRISSFFFSFLLLVGCSSTAEAPKEANATTRPAYALAIHGGAGGIDPTQMDAQQITAYEHDLLQALAQGEAILKSGGSATDAVQAAVLVLEDSPLFNAGRGAVFNSLGQHELDAAIMQGHNRKAGAVAGLRHTKNPIHVARLVMDSTAHVLLAGPGAELFAQNMGVEMRDSSYFFTQKRYRQLLQAQGRDTSRLGAMSAHEPRIDEHKLGTVGAVALDQHGNLAAATSTGGMTNKRFGRVGDAPLVGAGTWADNATCAISCTGTGEFFIRNAAAYDVAARMRYTHAALHDAMRQVLFEQIAPMGGSGGMIGVDQQGNLALQFTTTGMFRAWVKAGEKPQAAMFANPKQEDSGE